MAALNVASPFTGTITANANYCGGGPHGSVQLALPVDIAAAKGTSVRFYASSLVSKIKTFRMLDSVCALDPGDPWDTGVLVEMYNSSNLLVGKLFYAHLANAIASSSITNPNGTQIGTVPDYCPLSLCPDTDGDGEQNCFTGPHVHFEIAGIPGGPAPYRYATSCWSTAYYANTVIFRIDYS